MYFSDSEFITSKSYLSSLRQFKSSFLAECIYLKIPVLELFILFVLCEFRSGWRLIGIPRYGTKVWSDWLARPFSSKWSIILPSNDWLITHLNLAQIFIESRDMDRIVNVHESEICVLQLINKNGSLIKFIIFSSILSMFGLGWLEIVILYVKNWLIVTLLQNAAHALDISMILFSLICHSFRLIPLIFFSFLVQLLLLFIHAPRYTALCVCILSVWGKKQTEIFSNQAVSSIESRFQSPSHFDVRWLKCFWWAIMIMDFIAVE